MRGVVLKSLASRRGCRAYADAAPAVQRGRGKEAEDEFRVLDFLRSRQATKRPQFKREPTPPARALSMPTDQHWPSVWPGPKTFHPGTVPLPLRMGSPIKRQAPPGAFANAELMKIPNFLHLTPPAVRAQCEAIKRFCTPWPAGLDTDEKCDEKMPLQIITSDYCHSGPSIRDPLARIVSVRVKLSQLTLDKHAKDKILRLVGDRYDEETDYLTVCSERCPLRRQNVDYALYLLTAVYHESWTVEPWEAEKSEADMEEYVWEKNASRRSIVRWHTWEQGKAAPTDDEVLAFDVKAIPHVRDYEEAVSELMNNGENEYQLGKYKRAVLKVFGLPVEDQLDISSENRS